MQAQTTIRHHVNGPLPPTPEPSQTAATHKSDMMMAHGAFFWGKDSEILFSGWPGTSSAMYALALILVFVLAVLVECLSHTPIVRPGSNRVAAGLFSTGLHAVRAGLVYVVMLAVMSYNGGVFIAAVVGHAVGYSIFGSGLLKKSVDINNDQTMPTRFIH
ncbi:hypothetical protein Nepgr_024899 [Nepenthes gracilis]|uniref:Copper transport protein n=1 Tax=Nepenthes gracilis TaxID=150966 RepID=A0AAD3Y0Y4_NEPGR|nr:hypothetical protein Nepgr_024899 [Nepenthes gracilis]